MIRNGLQVVCKWSASGRGGLTSSAPEWPDRVSRRPKCYQMVRSGLTSTVITILVIIVIIVMIIIIFIIIIPIIIIIGIIIINHPDDDDPDHEER